MPTLPTTSHASHCPVQATLQQTPSTHFPEPQARSRVQATPLDDFATQVPALHQAPKAQSPSALHWVPQVPAEPVHRLGKQLGSPGWPAGRGEQVPSAVAPSAAAHVSQLPSHAVLQQKPSTQCWLEHSAFTLQVAPLGALPLHAPATQVSPEAHSASLPQVVPQEAELPVQRYGRHEGAPTEPCATKVHVPSADAPSATAQASQLPSQASLQHTPSAQKPEVQSEPWAHPCPFARVPTHTPPLQKYPEAHPCEFVHEVGQAEAWPEQT